MKSHKAPVIFRRKASGRSYPQPHHFFEWSHVWFETYTLVGYGCCQWLFQEPKIPVPTIYIYIYSLWKCFFWGDRPPTNLWFDMGQYLHGSGIPMSSPTYWRCRCIEKNHLDDVRWFYRKFYHIVTCWFIGELSMRSTVFHESSMKRSGILRPSLMTPEKLQYFEHWFLVVQSLWSTGKSNQFP